MQTANVPEFESLEIEKALGWRVFSVREDERLKTISTNEHREIVQLTNGASIYVLAQIPELSLQEALLLRGSLEHYRGSFGKEGAQSACEALKDFCRRQLLEPDEKQTEYLGRIISCITTPSGALSEFLKDGSLEEIAVIGIGKSRPVHIFDSSFGWLETNLYFSSAEEVKNVINAMASGIGRRITFQKPRLNAMLEDGSRLNACIEPASVCGPCVTIRKFRENPITPSELIKFNAASAEQMAFIWMAMQADCSALVCGNTGSGKTTLLNALLNFVPATERIIMVEETPEIRIPHTHTVRLATSEGIEIGMDELIVNTLRMRPDRVVVGEVRDRGEVGAFIDTLLAGQGKGSYGTFHAQSGKDAVARIRNLGALELDLCSLDLILTQKRWSSYSTGESREHRRLIEICEPRATKNGVECKQLFSYDFEKGEFVFHGYGESASAKICRAFGLRKNEIATQICRRKDFLLSLCGKSGGEFFAAVQDFGKTQR